MPDIPDALLQQLDATLAGDPWYGAPAARLLDGVTAEQARRKPVPGGHSIWEQVLHMISWTREVTRRIAGAAPHPPVEGDWPAGEGGEKEWEETRRALSQAGKELLRTIRAQAPSRWDEPVGTPQDTAPGTGLSVLGMVIGLAQHDAYHIGQIAMLKRAAGLL